MKRITMLATQSLFFVCVAANSWGLTLNEALAEAAARNPALLAARHRIEQASAHIDQSQSSRWPTIDLRLGYTVLAEEQAIVSRAGIQPTQEPEYAFASLSAEQTIYDFGRNQSREGTARALYAANEASVAAHEQEVFLQTVQAFFRVLESMRLVESSLVEIASLEEHRRIVSTLFDEGVVTRNDLLQAEVRLAASRQQHLLMKNRLENSWLQLNFITGSPPQNRPEIEGSFAALPLPGAATPDFQTRPDIKASRARLVAAEDEIRQRRSGFFPQIFARAEANYIENDYVREQTIYSATVGVKSNLFDGYATSAAMRRALAEAEEIRRQLDERELLARMEYSTARNDLHVAESRLELLKGSVEQAEENLRINLERYREQVGRASDVLDAQALLSQTKTDLFRAGYDLDVAKARVLKSLGKLGANN